MSETQQSFADLLCDCCHEERNLRAGEILFNQDDPGDNFYILRSGRLRVIRDVGMPSARVIGEIGGGEPVGEMAVLGEDTRSASVVAVRDSSLAEYRGSNLEDLSKSVLIDLMRTLSVRLKRSIQPGVRHCPVSSITVVPINAEAPLDAYCERLVGTVAAVGASAVLLDGVKVPPALCAAIEDESGQSGEAIHWIEEQQKEHGILVLKTDQTLTGWTRFCLRNCDVIILLGQAGSDPSKGEIEAAVDQMQPGHACPNVFLVLAQEEPPYHGTGEWLKDRNVVRHFHVRLGAAADKWRASRLLTGRDISLALGGGGARGFAHIGVLRALDEVGLPIDRIGGTSMGAIIAGLRAQELGWKEILKIVRRHFIEEGRLTDYTLPLLSIDTGRRYTRMLERMFGDLQIEDLPMNYFCISCNLTLAKPVVHRQGGLAKWIGASVSVPGIAPPLVESGELHVDGGLLNNLPADVIKAEGAGTVIGIDVSPETDLRMPKDYSGRPGAMEVLRSQIKLGKSKNSEPRQGYPTLGSILYRATCLSSIYQRDAVKSIADSYIKVPVGNFKMLDWKRIDELVEIGYQTGLKELVPLAEKMARLGLIEAKGAPSRTEAS